MKELIYSNFALIVFFQLFIIFFFARPISTLAQAENSLVVVDSENNSTASQIIREVHVRHKSAGNPHPSTIFHSDGPIRKRKWTQRETHSRQVQKQLYRP